MKTPRLFLLPAAAFLLVLHAMAADLSGRWQGQGQSPDGQSFTLAFNFKFEGDKLSGTVDGPGGTLPITDGKVQGGGFSFKVEFNGNTIDHQCKVEGDTIAMKTTFGQEGGMEMKLTRAAVPAPVAPGDPSGVWKWSFTPPNGEPFESTARFVCHDGKLSGTVTGRRGELPISDGTVKDGAIAFALVRERDGQKFVMKYSGRLAGDAIKGTFEFPGIDGNEPMKLDWVAARAK